MNDNLNVNNGYFKLIKFIINIFFVDILIMFFNFK